MQAEKYISDEVLIRRVLEGQQEDFTLLVERHASPLLHFVGRMIPVREEAEEIVQDTLLAAYQRLNDFDVRRASFTVWLQRIAFYTVSHHLRKHHPTFISMDESQDTISATTDAALDRLLSEEGPDLRELLDCALEQLRPEERMLLQLFYNDGQSLSDIAFIFGMTDKASTARAVSALTSRLHRIRKKLFVNIKRLRHEYQ